MEVAFVAVADVLSILMIDVTSVGNLDTMPMTVLAHQDHQDEVVAMVAGHLGTQGMILNII